MKTIKKITFSRMKDGRNRACPFCGKQPKIRGFGLVACTTPGCTIQPLFGEMGAIRDVEWNRHRANDFVEVEVTIETELNDDPGYAQWLRDIFSRESFEDPLGEYDDNE